MTGSLDQGHSMGPTIERALMPGEGGGVWADVLPSYQVNGMQENTVKILMRGGV